MYCKIVYFIKEKNSLKRRANLKLRGYNRFRNDPNQFLFSEDSDSAEEHAKEKVHIMQYSLCN